MDIFIPETKKVEVLSVDSDPTDTLLKSSNIISKLKPVDDDTELLAPCWADYVMSQKDFSYWSKAVNDHNKSEALEIKYTSKYCQELVDEVLKRYFHSCEFDKYGSNKISALNNYFKNEIECFHKLSDMVLDTESGYGFVAHSDGTYTYYIHLMLTDVLVPVELRQPLPAYYDDYYVGGLEVFKPGCDFDLEDVGISLTGFYDPNGYLDGDNALTDDVYNEDVMDHPSFINYVYDIACVSTNNEGLLLDDAIKSILNKEIAKRKLV